MLQTIIILNNSNRTVMGHFKYQLPIPNTHQFTHLSPEAHTSLVQLPARELRPPLTAQGHWSLPCPEGPVLLLGPLGPANSRSRAGQAEPGRAGRWIAPPNKRRPGAGRVGGSRLQHPAVGWGWAGPTATALARTPSAPAAWPALPRACDPD